MLTDFAKTLNAFGRTKTPFFFAVDFEHKCPIVFALDALPDTILYSIDGRSNALAFTCKTPAIDTARWMDQQAYAQAFSHVIEEIKKGNTYLLNLTFATPITLNGSLEDIFYASDALFKCCIKEHFVCFSPERFVKIEDNTIHTFPMKGTIDAGIENAESVILNDEKEMAEHVMVVDLLRNDLSMVACNVKVERFRYAQSIKAGKKMLLQISSHISGKLDEDWHGRVGSLLQTLLPAGSISGTPKKSSVAIIEAIEGGSRGFFTGVFGVYDGKTLDSGVMIRFIEKTPEGYVFKSGGGITLLSECEKEYDELCAKVYIPVH